MRFGESTQDVERSLFLVAVIVRDGVSGRPRRRIGSARDRYRPMRCSGRTRNSVHRPRWSGKFRSPPALPTRLEGPVRRLAPSSSPRVERLRLLMRENLTRLTMPSEFPRRDRSSESRQLSHRVRTRNFETWLNSAPKSPAKMALRLREILDRWTSSRLDASSIACETIRGTACNSDKKC
jgi:hypothetical protein